MLNEDSLSSGIPHPIHPRKATAEGKRQPTLFQMADPDLR